MSTVSLKDVKAGFSNFVDQAAAGEFVTITHHGRAAAVLVSVAAAEAARKALGRERAGLVDYLKAFPGDLEDDAFARNPAPSGEAEL